AVASSGPLIKRITAESKLVLMLGLDVVDVIGKVRRPLPAVDALVHVVAGLGLGPVRDTGVLAVAGPGAGNRGEGKDK
ncbi:hypothetical protein BGX27_002136, partial [Mortierella sp. AM989]